MKPLRYLSVCSGIEAASVAWEPLGWEAAAFSEIEAFPRAVLKHHFPKVPLHGDFTTIRGDEYGPIDLLVGGTPCQSFSIAGLRKGLDDDRGNLALEYLRLADRARPRWLVWENVPGVLSIDGGRAFGSILGGMAELGYGFAYRILDAQFVRVDGHGRAVPQRRRRVFVVGYLGDWRRAAAVLFDAESLRGNPAPRREAGQGVAGTVDASLARCSAPEGERGGLICGEIVGQAMSSKWAKGSSGPAGDECHNLVAHALRAEGFDASEDGTGRGTPLVPMCFDTTQITSPANRSHAVPGDPCHPLAAGMHPPAIAFSFKDSGNDAAHDLSPTLRSLGTYGANGRSQMAVAFDLRGREGGAQFEGPHDTANIRAASGGSSRSYVSQQWAVRRLTPTECERLQGFPDGWTDVPYRGKPAPDGPRYKALGNSMAVNVMRRIGRRIEFVERLLRERAECAA